MIFLSSYAVSSILFLLSMYAILSSFNDGIIGKLIYSVMALASYAAISVSPEQPTHETQVILAASLGAAVVREAFCRWCLPHISSHFSRTRKHD